MSSSHRSGLRRLLRWNWRSGWTRNAASGPTASAGSTFACPILSCSITNLVGCPACPTNATGRVNKIYNCEEDDRYSTCDEGDGPAQQPLDTSRAGANGRWVANPAQNLKQKDKKLFILPADGWTCPVLFSTRPDGPVAMCVLTTTGCRISTTSDARVPGQKELSSAEAGRRLLDYSTSNLIWTQADSTVPSECCPRRSRRHPQGQICNIFLIYNCPMYFFPRNKLQ